MSLSRLLCTIECVRTTARALPLWALWLLPLFLVQSHFHGRFLLDGLCTAPCPTDGFLVWLYVSAAVITWPLYRWHFIPLPVLFVLLAHLVFVIQTTACYVFFRWSSVLGVYVSSLDLLLIVYVLFTTLPYVQHSGLMRMCIWRAQSMIMPCFLVPQVVLVFVMM